MAARNTSSAYDLSVYESALQKQAKKPELRVIAKKSAKGSMIGVFTPRVLGSFAIVVTLICLMVYNQVCLNELTGEINRINQGIVEMQSEHTNLSSQLDAMISPRVVAERAKNELGMDRRDQYNTKYIRLYGEDKINLTENSPELGVADSARISARSLLDVIKEYIGI